MSHENDIINYIASQGEISQAVATRVFDHYVRARAITCTSHDGYRVVHGAFFEPDVIARAVRETSYKDALAVSKTARSPEF